MIVYHKNNEIDREQWDNCIRNSGCLKPYPYSWFLDIMAPGWEALVDDDYDSVFPLPLVSRLGFRKIANPTFIQHLGAYSPDKPESGALFEFLSFLPDFYRLIDLNIGQNISFDGFSVAEKKGYCINTSGTYEELWGGFSDLCRKNVDKAAKRNPSKFQDVTPDELINLYILNNGREAARIPAIHYLRLKTLMNFCLKNKKGSLWGFRDGRKRLLAGLFVIGIKGCSTVLLSASSAGGKERRLDYFMLNELIKSNMHGKSLVDFAGTTAPEGKSFGDLFGASSYTYYHIYRNSLIWPVRWFR